MKMSYPPDPEIPMAVLLVGVLLGFLGLIGLLFAFTGQADAGRWPFSAALLLVGAAASGAGKAVLDEAASFKNRFAKERRQAREELRVLGDEDDQAAYARKWFIRLCKSEHAIRKEFREATSDTTWINYLEDRAEQGGDDILAWYRQDLRLLELAKKIDAQTSMAEFKKARAMENLRLAGVVELGQEEIELEKKRLQDAHTPIEPWEAVL